MFYLLYNVINVTEVVLSFLLEGNGYLFAKNYDIINIKI